MEHEIKALMHAWQQRNSRQAHVVGQILDALIQSSRQDDMLIERLAAAIGTPGPGDASYYPPAHMAERFRPRPNYDEPTQGGRAPPPAGRAEEGAFYPRAQPARPRQAS